MSEKHKESMEKSHEVQGTALDPAVTASHRLPAPIQALVIRFEDNAERRTVETWVCKTCGRDHGNYERGAKWCCATDMPCDCGARMPRHYIKCQACRDTDALAKWEKRERRPWAEEPLYSETLERFLMDADDVQDAVDDNGGDPEGLRLVICDPIYANEIDDEYWCDEYPEDVYSMADVNSDIADALDTFNAVIKAQREAGRAISWQAGKFAAVVALPIFRSSE